MQSTQARPISQHALPGALQYLVQGTYEDLWLSCCSFDDDPNPELGQ